jgi:hypothetical protein
LQKRLSHQSQQIQIKNKKSRAENMKLTARFFWFFAQRACSSAIPVNKAIRNRVVLQQGWDRGPWNRSNNLSLKSKFRFHQQNIPCSECDGRSISLPSAPTLTEELDAHPIFTGTHSESSGCYTNFWVELGRRRDNCFFFLEVKFIQSILKKIVKPIMGLRVGCLVVYRFTDDRAVTELETDFR